MAGIRRGARRRWFCCWLAIGWRSLPPVLAGSLNPFEDSYGAWLASGEVCAAVESAVIGQLGFRCAGLATHKHASEVGDQQLLKLAPRHCGRAGRPLANARQAVPEGRSPSRCSPPPLSAPSAFLRPCLLPLRSSIPVCRADRRDAGARNSPVKPAVMLLWPPTPTLACHWTADFQLCARAPLCRST